MARRKTRRRKPIGILRVNTRFPFVHLGGSAPKCTVKFKHERNRVGATAVLMWNGQSLNYVYLPRPTVANARVVKQRLMKGCTELVRSAQRSRRHWKRRGDWV